MNDNFPPWAGFHPSTVFNGSIPMAHPRIQSIFVAAIILATAGPSGRTQDVPTFSSNVKVVNVPATVRNKKGEIVRDLSKDDFVLAEDGRPQAIRYFSRENDLPLTLGLLVDTSLSQRRVLGEERDASSAFLDQMLREDRDKAFLIHFEGDVELLQDLTSSREKLRSALQDLRVPQGRQWGGRHGTGGTSLYDAVFLASDELMKQQKGRKALIILSDGVDNASRISLERAIEAAQRSDTLVYAILFSDEQAYGGGWSGGWGGMGRRGGYPRFPIAQPNGKKVLQRIARETGARMFEVSRKDSIGEIYAQIQEELRNQYSLGYSPDRAPGASGYHRIRVATKEKDLLVQARDGYYAER